MTRSLSLLLNVAHALDHLFLLIFATAVATIAIEFGFTRWEDLMPYGVGAFVMFGLGSLPAGRLGDLWGRRAAGQSQHAILPGPSRAARRGETFRKALRLPIREVKTECSRLPGKQSCSRFCFSSRPRRPPQLPRHQRR